MNKLISTLKIITLIFIFSACTGNEINEDCYTCENTATTYCINQGDDFYLEIPTNGSPTTVPLNGEFWNDIKTNLEAACQNGPQLDCYTCELTNTMYCYLPGDTFYTSSIDNAAATQINLNEQTWQEIKANLQDECVDPTQDCYTCVSEATQYCYTEGDDFYTSTVNNNETQIDLNGQTWTAIRAGLEGNCNNGSGNVATNRAIMTAIINGDNFPILQPTLYPSFSNASRVVTYFQFDDDHYIKLQGNDNPNNPTNITREINLYIHESNWQVGTFDIEPNQNNQKSHFQIIYLNSGDTFFGVEIGGTITITNIDTTGARVIQGTFEFTYNLDNTTVGETTGPYTTTGTFDYSLDDEYFD